MKDSKKLRPLSDARREYDKMKLRPENKKFVKQLVKGKVYQARTGTLLDETIQNDRKADEALTRDIKFFTFWIALGIGFFLGVILTVSIMIRSWSKIFQSLFPR